MGYPYIQNSDITATAAIDFSKLAALTSAHILVGSAGAVATDTAVSGDITISNTGVTTLKNTGPGITSVTHASLTIDAQGRVTALSSGATPLGTALTSAHIFVGNAGNVATDTAVTGDITITNTGVTTLKNTGPGVTTVTNANITIDAQGRVTAAANGSATALDVKTKTADYTLTNSEDVVLANPTGGATITITLMTAASATKKMFYIKNISANGMVNIVPNAADTIEGDSVLVLPAGGTPKPGNSLFPDGSNTWYVWG